MFIAALIFGCNNKSKNNDFEKDVFIQIIPYIVDSVSYDPRLSLYSSPYPLFPPAGTEISEKEKIRLTEQWKLKIDSIKNDTSYIFLAINPLIKFSTDSLEKKLTKHTNRKILKINSNEKLTLDINSLKLNKHFKFKHESLFSKTTNVWHKKYDFVFSGFFNVSRIVFDESKSYGILSTSYSCGDRCGQGYIYIKKEGDRWKIDKIEETWVS